MKIKIVTPQKTLYDGETNYLALNTDDGEQVILNGHAPYMAKIEIGELVYNDGEGNQQSYAVGSGFIQVLHDEVRLLLDNAVNTLDIDLKSAEEAKARAENLLKDMHTQSDISKIKAQIRISNLHISTYKKYKIKHTAPTEEIAH